MLRQTAVDILISDVGLPDGSGRAVAIAESLVLGQPAQAIVITEEPQDAPWSRMGGSRNWRLVVGSLRHAPRALDIGPMMRLPGKCIRYPSILPQRVGAKKGSNFRRR